MDDFGVMAKKYDIFNSADYDAYCEFVKKAFAMSDIKIEEVLDLGCGTGELTVRIADEGYSVTAVDVSPDMLYILREKIGNRDILPVCQDMTSLDLYGTVQGGVSSFDCFNYLLTSRELSEAFEKIGLFTEKGGIFVFDVNTDYAYNSVYGTNSYVYEDGEDMLVWRNFYNPKTKKCDFYLTAFDKKEKSWERRDAVHVQKNHSRSVIEKAVKDAGFAIIGVYGNTDFTPVTEESRKNYYILKKCRCL